MCTVGYWFNVKQKFLRTSWGKEHVIKVHFFQITCSSPLCVLLLLHDTRFIMFVSQAIIFGWNFKHFLQPQYYGNFAILNHPILSFLLQTYFTHQVGLLVVIVGGKRWHQNSGSSWRWEKKAENEKYREPWPREK